MAATVTRPNIDEIQAHVLEARRRIGSRVYGNDDTVTLLFVALAAKGHALIEGVPGVGKTTLANAFATVTGLQFGRIQLTPDLLPTDILGHSFYDQKAQEFAIRYGPVFTNVLLADELNRTPPRTQSALLEVMQEHQVTIEGKTKAVPEPFFVIATKNPIETEGVYPLPEAERDRFMVHSIVRYPEREVEDGLLTGRLKAGRERIEPLPGLAAMLQDALPHVEVHKDVRGYLLDVVRATRDHPSLEYGCSPRGGEQLLQAARAHALLEGRWFVVPDDVRDLAIPVMRHRMMRTADAEVQELPMESIIEEILDSVAVPIKP
ncbi:MAG: AAA family ATPase [Thermoplasmatota archaeon]